MSDRNNTEDRIRRALTSHGLAIPEGGDRWPEVQARAGRARAARRARLVGGALASVVALGAAGLFVGNPLTDGRDPVVEAATKPPSSGPAVPAGTLPDGTVLYPLWPSKLTGPSAFDSPSAAALEFTRSYLGFDGLEIVSESRDGDQARVAVGYYPEEGSARPATAAVLRLARAEGGRDRPWQVLGTDAEAVPRFEITTVQQPSPGQFVVRGAITGVDESIRVAVHQPSSPEPLGSFCCIGAGLDGVPWEARFPTQAATDPVLTVVASTGGHVADVESFVLMGVNRSDSMPTKGQAIPGGPPCRAGSFGGKLESRNQAMNQPSFYFSLTNQGGPCTAAGYPAVRLLDRNGAVLPIGQSDGGGFIARDPRPTELTVPTSAKVFFAVSSVTICRGEPPEAPLAAALEVRLLGGETTRIATAVPYCPRSEVAVTALTADLAALEP